MCVRGRCLPRIPPTLPELEPFQNPPQREQLCYEVLKLVYTHILIHKYTHKRTYPYTHTYIYTVRDKHIGSICYCISSVSYIFNIIKWHIIYFFCESYIRIQNIWPLKNRKWQCVIFLNFKMVSERLYLEGQKGKKFALIMTENQRNLLLSPHIGFILQNGKKKKCD